MRFRTALVLALACLGGLALPAGAARPTVAARYSVSGLRVLLPARSGPVGASAPANLTFGGGTAAAVQVHPAAYVVFWGSQWNRQDPLAAYELRFLRGLYGRGDDWSEVPEQYCSGVPARSLTCPRSAPHVGRPIGAFLKGSWFDDTARAVPISSPVYISGQSALGPLDTLTAEVIAAAVHFGNRTPASNVGAQYIINTPSQSGTPGAFVQYCAYHGVVHSPYGDLAFTNMPYVTDVETGQLTGVRVGPSCGQNFVNTGQGGTFDGVSIVLGHEILETVSDTVPGQGWTDPSNGYENGDKCAWIASGQGHLDNLRLSTGTFAVQSTWSNAFHNGTGGCVLHARHP